MQGMNYRLDIKKGLLVMSNDWTISSTQHSALVFHLSPLLSNLIPLFLARTICVISAYFQFLSMIACCSALSLFISSNLFVVLTCCFL